MSREDVFKMMTQEEHDDYTRELENQTHLKLRLMTDGSKNERQNLEHKTRRTFK